MEAVTRKTTRICCILIITACCVYATNSQRKGATPSASASSLGARLFPANCASCHGLDGHGGERATDIVGRREIQKLPDASLAKIIREGVSGTGMPSFRTLGNTKIQAIVRYLRTLQGQNSVCQLPGSPVAGKSLFFGKAGCSDCHMVNGTGGFMGSDLSVYGRSKGAAEIHGVIVNPAEYLHERGAVVVVTTSDGQSVTGIARNEDNFSIQIQTKDGAFHFFDKSSLRGVERRAESLMPSDYGTRLSGEEVNDLISYLMEVARNAESANTDDKVKQEAEEPQE
jgi:cytochrome c oxidase cbb3-type subunit III